MESTSDFESQSMGAQTSEADITDYLRNNPQFFEHHPDLLAMMHLPSPHGSGTVSLAERQQQTQRDRIRTLEGKLSEFLQFGQENDTISAKVHRLSLGLLAAQNFEVLIPILMETLREDFATPQAGSLMALGSALDSLREDFAVPYAGLRIWAEPQNSNHVGNPVFQPVDSELSQWAEGLSEPYCGNKPGLDISSWFGENATPKSFALVALRGEKVFGLLAIASDDEKRFYPDMGTMYLKRIGELVSASLLRYIS